MSASVVVRAAPGGAVFGDRTASWAWLVQLADRHGLEVEDEELLIGDRLVLEPLAVEEADATTRPARRLWKTRRQSSATGQVNELWVTHRLSYDRPAQEREGSRQLRAVLGDLLDLAEAVGGQLHCSDDDRRLAAGDLDWWAGVTRDAHAADREATAVGSARPEFLGVDLAALSKADAQEVMNRWLADEPARMAWLADRLALGPSDEPPVVLDHTPESLVSVWRRIRPQLALRQPADSFEPARLPIWANSSGAYGHPDFSDETLWLVDAVARYWAATLCRATGDRWVLGRSRVPGYVDQNRPILEKYDGFPITPILVSADIELEGDPRAGDDRLKQLLDRAVGRA